MRPFQCFTDNVKNQPLIEVARAGGPRATIKAPR